MNDSVKKEKSVANPFFQIMLNEVRKMISGDVKTDVKQMEIKDLVVVSLKLFLYTFKS